MRSSLLVIFLATATQATFFGLGCGICGGGFSGGYGGYGSSYGGSYGGGYGSGYSSYGGGTGSYPSYGMSNMNAPGAYFQPNQNFQTLYAGQPYFTPANSGYGQTSYGGSYAQSYGQPSPTYTQIFPLPANAQIVNNIPSMAQYPPTSVGGYAQPSFTPQTTRTAYAQPAPIPVQSPPPPPPSATMAPPQENSYVQPAAPVRPYESVPHAAVETSSEEEQVAPTASPVPVPSESSDYGETETETEVVSDQPTVVKTTQTYSQPAAPVYQKEQVQATNMINSPEEAGYRRVLVKKLKRKL